MPEFRRRPRWSECDWPSQNQRRWSVERALRTRRSSGQAIERFLIEAEISACHSAAALGVQLTAVFLSMHLAEIKEVHDNEPKINTDYFLKTHLAIEAATLRLGLIALRLKKLPYEQARKAIRSRWIRPASDLREILDSIDEESARRAWSDYGLERLIEAFKDYSSKFRNKILHAAIPEIYNEDELTLCIEINVELLHQLEKSLRQCFDHSLFESPSKWGAKICKSMPEDTMANVFGRKQMSQLLMRRHDLY